MKASKWVGGWRVGGWRVHGVGDVGGWRVYGVGVCVMVWVVGGFMRWVGV